ncbi:MAG: helix-turn-helix transcriptional regulator [Clostridia bacterium]|nr:helix-turn-helix transcriptional regulator [Clostridia bacterium]
MFYEKLIELRKKAGLSQEELGDKIGVSRQAVSRWELGTTTPELDKLLLLSEVFNCSLDELVGKEPLDSTATESPRDDKNEEKRTVVQFVRPEYEYKSKTTVCGVPLVHIHVGFGLCRAKGIIAIGNVATGVVALGGLAVGVFSLGGFALGLLAIGGLAFALLLALGGGALGFIAVGGIAVGIFAVGGVAIGIYAIGGVAVASNIALGGYASGQIAIGGAPHGSVMFNTETDVFTKADILRAIDSVLPNTPEFLKNLFSIVGR